MRKLVKAENILNVWLSSTKVEYSDNLIFKDKDYMQMIYHYFNCHPTGKEYYKGLIIGRLKNIIAILKADKSDYINEELRMWKRLSKTGKDFYSLNVDSYPLSYNEFRVSIGLYDFYFSALCNYTKGTTRKNVTCKYCPIDWSAGTCHTLINKWKCSKNREERKLNALEIVKEIKNKRTDQR